MNHDNGKHDFSSFLSPFTWRYGSAPMRAIWSEQNKRTIWRRIWVALARAQHSVGIVSAEQLQDIEAHADNFDIDRSLAIEVDIRHDLMAELKCFAEQCPIGGRVIHLGATSLDVEDNAEVIRIQAALDHVLNNLEGLLTRLAQLISSQAAVPANGFSHLQPAEPVTVGFRLAQYGQDLMVDLDTLRKLRADLRGKGIRGAVGTAASFVDLLTATGREADHEQAISAFERMEQIAMSDLGLEAIPIANQTYPRKQDLILLNGLSGLGQSLYRFAFDLRLLQSPGWGEWFEPAGTAQVSSSAMPSKRNPVDAETICSLARFLSAMPGIAWNNAAHALFERTLDDAANRNEILPCAFLATDEILLRARRILDGIEFNDVRIAANLQQFSAFAAAERVLMAGTIKGADRQALHEVLRRHCMAAWEAVRAGKPNPLAELIMGDRFITSFVSADAVPDLIDVGNYVGIASKHALTITAKINAMLDKAAMGRQPGE